MPRVDVIADHHGRPVDECWRCCAVGPVERAHLVDRTGSGLDGPQNLALLCDFCHRLMPTFRFDQGDKAIAYAMPAEPGMHQQVDQIIDLVGRDWWNTYQGLPQEERVNGLRTLRRDSALLGIDPRVLLAIHGLDDQDVAS